MVARSIGKMENSSKLKSHPCKNCIISMVCTEPCEKYYPDICILNSMSEYRRAMNFSLVQQIKLTVRINKNRHIDIFRYSIYFYKNHRLHRDRDKPAVIYSNGTRRYYKNGELHRDEDKPAVIYPNGRKRYYKNGKFIRKEEPPM